MTADELFAALGDFVEKYNAMAQTITSVLEAQAAAAGSLAALNAAFTEYDEAGGFVDPEDEATAEANDEDGEALPIPKAHPQVCCATCGYFDAGSTFCQRWNAPPPPEIQATGCDQWAINMELLEPPAAIAPPAAPAPAAKAKPGRKTKPATAGLEAVPF